jgi:predicted membrane-bound spermidine synthase
MYHVIGTGLTTIFLYLISYFFCRIGFYTIQFHRKIWNSVLAIAFVVCAIAGLFMALQISYKWDIPIIKSILKWHVEFGIGLAVTGILHFIWHFSYYCKLLLNNEEISDNKSVSIQTSTEISTNLFIIGFVSSSVQLLLIREVLIISGGYELITGTFLGSWLIGSAIGASLASKSALTDVKKINLIFSLSPVVSILLLLFLSRLYLNTGETPSFLVSVVYTFIVLIPFCMASGFTFVKLVFAAKSENDFIPGKSFSLETTGGVVSGLLLSFLTAGFFNTYQILLLIIILYITYVLFAFFISSVLVKKSVKFFILLLSSLVIILNPDILFRQILLPGIKVTQSKDTPYGNITTGVYKSEKSVYYNQRLLSYNDDVIEREENIHYAMLQSFSPEKVILISGSLNSHLPEILKYPVKKLIYIERDPALAKSEISSKDVTQLNLVISNNDAFRYIRNSAELVDVILLLIPPPSTLLINRYYTTEFFISAKKKLNSGGIFMCTPGPGDNYLNKESLNLYSSIYNSLTSVFKNVKPVIGNKLYFLASDNDISLSFCKISEKRNIKNIYVSSDFLDDENIGKKSNEVISLMDHTMKQNRSAFPVACFHFQSYIFSKNQGEKIPAIVLMILIFAMPILTIKRSNLLMYFSASALAGFEIIMLLTLQLTIGNMYQLTGLIIAGLMSGLAAGAGLNLSFLNSLSFRLKGYLLMGFYIGIGLIFSYIITINNSLIAVVFLIFSVFLPALLTGHLFREFTNKTDQITKTSSIYSADLVGSAFGFILVSGIAIPVFGIKVSIYLLSSLIFAGILFGTVRNK